LVPPAASRWSFPAMRSARSGGSSARCRPRAGWSFGPVRVVPEWRKATPMSVPRPKRPAWTRRLLACRFDLRQGRTGVGRCAPDRGFRHPLIRPAVPACSRGAGVAADAACRPAAG